MGIMGQNSSRSSVASSVHEKFRKKYREPRGQSDLSATFNILDSELHYEQMNINQATEEELMTLNGISRITARNIVEYRQTIGTFRKVEDLALVSGVGATKLEQIRSEICVSSKRRSNLSVSSSLNPSIESIPSTVTSNGRSNVKTPCLKIVNVNKANVFQLMSVRGIDQLMAANIVHHREKRGPFKLLDDIGRVKGLSHRLVAELRQYLTVDPAVGPVECIPRTPQRTPQNLHRPLASLHRRTRSMPPKCDLPFPSFDASDLFELLSNKSRRPISDIMFNFRRNGRSALRLATWNLQHSAPEKADNLGVREVICRTILENGISLVAVQELGDKEVLEKVCAELNNPCLRKVQEWPGARGTWEYVASEVHQQVQQSVEYRGFLFDTCRGLNLKNSGLLTPEVTNNNGSLVKKPFWATFQAGKVDFTVVCVHMSATSSVDNIPQPSCVLDCLEHLNQGENVIVLGDMNLSPIEPEFNSLRAKGFSHIVPVGTYTSSNTRNISTPKGYDNIWISQSIQKFFTGHWGVVRQGLSHLAIPHGWTWGGLMSDYCPVWAEFYAQTSQESSLTNGRIREEDDVKKENATTHLASARK